MIQIIELGSIKKSDEPVKTKCAKCSTKFSYQKEDIQSDRDGSYVVCPLCKSFIAAR